MAKVVACVNHDFKAIESHWMNHRDVAHFNEDMRTLDLTRLVSIVNMYRRLYPKALVILWASLECTNFSKAKGGMARDADSRTLADFLHRYILALNPHYIKIENVVEFKDWGPMRIKAKALHADRCDLHIQKKVSKETINVYKYVVDKKTKQKHIKAKAILSDRCELTISKKVLKEEYQTYGWVPVKETKGQDYQRWCAEVRAHGYRDEWKMLNSADFGAYTSRERLFGVFARPDLPIVWPAPTHAKRSRLKKLKNSTLKPWKAVRKVLDFSDEGFSIFDRELNNDIPKQFRKELVEATLERVYYGLVKHVAGGKDAFMAKTYAVASNGHGTYPLDVPSHTLTTRSAQQIVKPLFISKYNGGDPDGRNTSLTEPCRTITTENRHALVTGTFISKYFSGKPDGKNISIDGPAGTIKTVDSQALVRPVFMVQRNTGNPEYRSVDLNGPARTVTSTGGNQDLVFLSNYYGNVGGGTDASISAPCPTLRTKGHLAIIKPVCLVNYQHSSKANSLFAPSPTLVCKDKYAVLQAAFLDMQYSGKANHQSVDAPAGVITTNPKHSLVQATFIDRNFSGGGQNSAIDEPVGTILSVPKLNIVKAIPFVMNTNYGNVPTSIFSPAPVITANRKWPYLVQPMSAVTECEHIIFNPSWGSNTHSVAEPCPVVVARQDKSPLYLLYCKAGHMAVPIYDTDSPYTIKIKEFMALYGIADIKMRMLKVLELLRIQGFPKGYTLLGSQADQKKFIGNSVVPHVVMAWTLALGYELEEIENLMAA